MPYVLRKTKKVLEQAKTILDSITPISGECRTVYACGDCGHLFGRRFIPYGIGRGLTVGACMCQLTGHRPMLQVLTTGRES